MITKAPKFLLEMDPITCERPSANAAGTAVTWTPVFVDRGTVGTPSQRDLLMWAEPDVSQVVDNTLSLKKVLDVRVNDRITTPRGRFNVLAVTDHRLQRRALLQKVG